MEKTITPGSVAGTVLAPSSKSYAQRALAASLLCEGVSELTNMEWCDDTRAAMKIAENLGARITPVENTRWDYSVQGGLQSGMLSPLADHLNVGESGLATRLFTPIAALCGRKITLSGKGSILSRPVGMMEEPLRQLGAEIKTKKGFLPLTVQGPLKGGEVRVDGSLSSQFLTGLLMALPLAKNDTTLHVEGLRSRPYIDMTIAVAKHFGIRIDHNNYEEFFVEGGQCYEPTLYNIEGDWSGASCLLVAGAIAGEVTVENMNMLSLQADAAIINALIHAGAEVISTPQSVTVHSRTLSAFEFDATDCPDLFPALVALASACKGVSTIKGTRRLLHKESNRAQTLADEFSELGIRVDISEENTMRVEGGPITGGITDSHNDHRIAMALATAALRADRAVTIRHAEAVNKSYPDFWTDLEELKGLSGKTAIQSR